MEHLWAAGNGLFGEGTEKAKKWVKERENELWEGRVEDVRLALREKATEEDGGPAEEQLHYFETNQERMRYAVVQRRAPARG